MKIKCWLPVILWMILVYYLSSIPNLKTSSNPQLDLILRNLAHWGLYLIGYLLFFRALNKKNYWLPLVLTVIYSLTDEIHQTFVPTRSFQLMDLALDFFGAFSGKSIIKLLNIK